MKVFIEKCQESPKVFSLCDELAQGLALVLDVFPNGITIYILRYFNTLLPNIFRPIATEYISSVLTYENQMAFKQELMSFLDLYSILSLFVFTKNAVFCK